MSALGTSFTRWRAEDLGLDYKQAFRRILSMDLDVLRLSASWREIDQFGFGHLDWLMGEADRAGRRTLLTVGMKALGWPEFYLPEGLAVNPDNDGRRPLLGHVASVVRRYRSYRCLAGWQIENEPFNRSGPQARSVDRSTVRQEASLVRRLDPTRPLVVTTFARFDTALDRWSNRHQSDWARRLHLDLPAEREALAVLGRGDILGLDVYRAIGWRDGESDRLAHAAGDQLGVVARWQRISRQQGKRFWVTEAQAEPWEASRRTHGDPLSVRPSDVADLFQRLAAIGAEAVLLWGSEYWLWRDVNGDPRWLDSVKLVRRALA